MASDDDRQNSEVYRRYHDGPKWLAEGGEPLPPDPGVARKLRADDYGLRTFLFTCTNCGRRLASPPGPPSEMTCGKCGGKYVCHTFEPSAYQRLRWYGDPRKEGTNAE